MLANFRVHPEFQLMTTSESILLVLVVVVVMVMMMMTMEAVMEMVENTPTNMAYGMPHKMFHGVPNDMVKNKVEPLLFCLLITTLPSHERFRD